MKSLRDYLAEAEYAAENPIAGDDFAIIIREECLLETYITEETEDGIVLYADEQVMAILENYNLLDAEETDETTGCMDEAEYQGRKVALGKPMAGDVKKSKVYVRGPKGNVVKVNFGHGGTSAKRAGQKTMKIKKSNPARRKSFRARHNCANPGPRWKARYWSCRAW
jgi:hypothetical protein